MTNTMAAACAPIWMATRRELHEVTELHAPSIDDMSQWAPDVIHAWIIVIYVQSVWSHELGLPIAYVEMMIDDV